jgi:glycosyltransferase involved in cell wall biosynthesis
MKTGVIIPTYNESAAIGDVVKAVRAQGLDVVVIDDGSSDGTPILAKAWGAVVLINAKNMGKGACLIKGFDYVLKNGYDSAVTMDGDGQHLPWEISLLITAADQNPKCGIVIGNRMLKRAGMPLSRVLTNKIMSWLISCISRQDIPDTQCGFRLIRRELLEKVTLTTAKYETESEILIKASRLGFCIKSVPITSVYLNERSHINPLVDTLRFLWFVVKNLM